uniref:TFIIB-type domain-containing protein n=1 Tax=Leersia perrieri TaxID=77586 RepID=A0A0D9XSQ5_9ORYZ
MDGGNDQSYCKDCRLAVTVVVDHATGDTICTDCGLVLEERYVDETSEWRTFSDSAGGEDRDPNRLGGRSDPFLTHAQLGTVVASTAAKRQSNATSLPRVHLDIGRESSSQENSLVVAFRAITDMAEQLHLVATIRDHAKEIFKKLEEAKLCPKGRNRDATYAACLHMACRKEGKPRTYAELATVVRDDARADATKKKKEIGRVVKIISEQLGEKDGHAMGVGVVVVRAADYMVRFGSTLGMGKAEVRAAQRAAQRLDERLDVRRNPESIAAAIIYMLAQRAGAKTSARDVSAVTNVAEVTIREACKELTQHAELLFSSQE